MVTHPKKYTAFVMIAMRAMYLTTDPLLQ